MSPRTKEQFQEIRESSRAKIMDVAFDLFASKGYHQSSVAEIASQAGVSKGLIYNYFDSKEQLLVTVVHATFMKVEKYYPYLLNRGDVEAAILLERYIRDTIKLLSSEKGFWRKLYMVILQPEVAALILPVLEEFMKVYMPLFHDLFKELGVSDPQTQSILFGAHFDGIALGYIAASDLMSEEAITQALIELYIPERLRSK